MGGEQTVCYIRSYLAFILARNKVLFEILDAKFHEIGADRASKTLVYRMENISVALNDVELDSVHANG
ncbi:hypothetical protein NC651_038138 [Populus alba x Populus x berolinensis]|nr:hypothetical protein NC651_038138 [Populus alba x Populus x berolinensis]